MKPNKITIHCSATKNGVLLPIDQLREMHKARGWSDVGYHLVIQPDGQVDNGRPLNKKGAHVEGHNDGNLGICLVGTDQFGRQQIAALRYKIDSLIFTYNIPKWEIYTHHQFDTAIKQGKTCPNISINKLLYWYYTGDHNSFSDQFISS